MFFTNSSQTIGTLKIIKENARCVNYEYIKNREEIVIMSDEFNKNENSKDETNKIGENESSQYSFWAEQVTANDSSSRTQESNTSQNQHRNQTTQPHINYQGPYQQGTYRNGPTYQQNRSYYQRAAYNPYTGQPIPPNSQVPPQNFEGNTKKKNRKQNKVVKIILGAACFGAIAGITFIGMNELFYHFNPQARARTYAIQGNTDSRLSTTAPSKENQLLSTKVLNTQALPDTDVTTVYKETLPSIVAINSTVAENINFFGQTYRQESEGNGSGIIVGETEKELLIATNNHVVNGASKIVVTFIDGEKAEAIVKGTEASSDLAVVSIDITSLKKETIEAIKIATLGSSDNVKEGEMAIAIGNALGYGQSMTVGYVSALNRDVEFETGTMTLLQTDAAINPGNSGGALLNVKGEVIGINCAKLAENRVEGMGYAIPISKAIPIINELMSREIIKEEDQGYLGVYIQDITEEASQMYHMPIGVYIVDFSEDSPAKEAGILAKDIVTGINGVEITTRTGLKEKVSSYKYGTKISVTLQRAENGTYKEKTIEVTLGKKPTKTSTRE